MSELRVHRDGEQQCFSYSPGVDLLHLLRQNNYHIEAPCGGNGTCGKCRVKVRQQGIVTACMFYPDTDIEVFLPNTQESKILTAQHSGLRKLPLQPGALATQNAYPVGLALDVGTTSIVFYWVSLITGSIIQSRGISNPQGKYGADVISRIQYCATTNGLSTLQGELVKVINEQIQGFIKQQGLTNANIVKISVAANTTMLHLMAGMDPTSIATVPFKPAFTQARILPAEDLNITCHSEAKIHLLPSISAYVGADIVAGLTALSPKEEIQNYLFIDIGTNGEMALVTPQRIICCATAAGPAFEGANIRCGMGAFDGAISSFNEAGYRTISDEKPIGICGSGLIDAVAYLLDHHFISQDGLLEKDFVLADKEATGHDEAVVITPQDIREVQLAKSAIASGIQILLQLANLTYDAIDALYLAGGFGNYLKPESATRIGLLPIELNDRIIPVGNTSGAGAVLHLQSELFEAAIEDTLNKAQHIELSDHSDFEMAFAMNMYF